MDMEDGSVVCVWFHVFFAILVLFLCFRNVHAAKLDSTQFSNEIIKHSLISCMKSVRDWNHTVCMYMF